MKPVNAVVLCVSLEWQVPAVMASTAFSQAWNVLTVSCVNLSLPECFVL